MRGTKAKQLRRLVVLGAARAAAHTDPVTQAEESQKQNQFFYKKISRTIQDKVIEVMGPWFRHPESIRAQYQRAKVLYKIGMLNI